MPRPMRLWQLKCPACNHKTVCGNADMVARLRNIGMLKRVKVPDAEMMDALLPTAAPRLPCDACGKQGLLITHFEDEWDDDDWSGGRACEACGAMIPPERLEALPATRRCAACQGRSESGQDSAEHEFCPRCGGLMKMRQTSQGGITRYSMTCPECG